MYIFVRGHKRNLFMTIERTCLSILDQSFLQPIKPEISCVYLWAIKRLVQTSNYEISSSTNTCNELFSHTIWISSIQNCKPLLSSVCALYRKEEAFWSYHLLPFVNAFTQIVLQGDCIVCIPWMFTIIGSLTIVAFCADIFSPFHDIN